MSYIAAPLRARAVLFGAKSHTAAPALAVGATRRISATTWRSKGPIEVTKETIKKTDRVISDAAVKGIEKGQEATHKIKDTMGMSSEEAKSKVEHAKGEAAEMAGHGKGKMEEMVGEAKGKTKEAVGEAKGKASEMSAKASS